MAATAEMPYFINPSRNLTAEEKEQSLPIGHHGYPGNAR